MAVLLSRKIAVVAVRAAAERSEARLRATTHSRADRADRRGGAVGAGAGALETVVGRGVRDVEDAVIARVAGAARRCAIQSETAIAHARGGQ